ncbi:hypothetical protein OOT46_28095 [Aquabacterium sp. A7-Y]|uniref:hypothetical protein n=1 Tax=Aquabacterium sp. A7-Y TaxID=1349605 RepID=UPI00223D8822|nr:hypothetical protein [Aquabacterium sp. A7-Y]MCW7541664.1 hypothetical protein [Aquabacterium sp. A7-Y]
MEAPTKVGVTAEGLPCAVTLYYPDGAPEGALPERITGMYQAADGPGAFMIERDGERYRDADSGELHEHAHELLPWVVADGVW